MSSTRSVNDAPPRHPELLDYLAVELMDNGWSVEHIHRLMLNSKTWQQINPPNQNTLSIDAGSRLLGRFPPRRREAEAIRDPIYAITIALASLTIRFPTTGSPR